ncbi:MAG TPA: GAP family protein [Acidimicrobiia bacterium]|nr:GAP family protein [Acidimicrobiia bacterium]
MADVTVRIVLYALVAATSPLALGATLAVLRSDRPRINGVVFTVGFLVGQAAVFLLAFALGDAAIGQPRQTHATLERVLELVVGVGLLVAAAHVRPRRLEPRPHRQLGPRTKAMLTRLSRLSPGAALASGSALGIGGPKRLGITLVAAAAVSAAALGRVEEFSLLVVYVLVGTVLVWAPVTLFVVFGTRATEWIAGAQAWVSDHQAPLTFYPALVVGLGLTLDGLFQIV